MSDSGLVIKSAQKSLKNVQKKCDIVLACLWSSHRLAVTENILSLPVHSFIKYNHHHRHHYRHHHQQQQQQQQHIITKSLPDPSFQILINRVAHACASMDCGQWHHGVPCKRSHCRPSTVVFCFEFSTNCKRPHCRSLIVMHTF